MKFSGLLSRRSKVTTLTPLKCSPSLVITYQFLYIAFYFIFIYLVLFEFSLSVPGCALWRIFKKTNSKNMKKILIFWCKTCWIENKTNFYVKFKNSLIKKLKNWWKYIKHSSQYKREREREQQKNLGDPVRV